MAASVDDEPKEMVDVSVSISEPLWCYMQCSTKYSDALEKVKNTLGVSLSFEDVDGGTLKISGSSAGDVEKAQTELDTFISHCQEAVQEETFDFGEQPDLLARTESCIGDPKINAHIYIKDGVVHVLGTAGEVSEASKMIEEKLEMEESGIGASDGSVPGTLSAEESGKNEEDQTDDHTEESLGAVAFASTVDQVPENSESSGEVAAEASSENESHIIELDTDLWKYMQKNNNYAGQVRRLRDDMHVDVVESIVKDPSEATGERSPKVRLLFSGPEDDVEQAINFTCELIQRCQENTSTVRVPCQDNKVFSKIVKMINSLNKSQGLVSAADEVVCVTGSQSEVKECSEKLTNLSLVVPVPEKKLPVSEEPSQPGDIPDDFQLPNLKPDPPGSQQMGDAQVPEQFQDFGQAGFQADVKDEY